MPVPLLIFLIVIIALLGLFIFADLTLLLVSISRGAPFVRTNPSEAQTIVSLAEPARADFAVDLGAGDGSLMIALAAAGASVVGYEINPLLVLRARRKIKRAGLEKLAKVYLRSFWKQDLSKFSIITVYGISYIMPKLEKKLRRELVPGARIVSKGFRFPTWPLVKQKGNVYLYKR